MLLILTQEQRDALAIGAVEMSAMSDEEKANTWKLADEGFLIMQEHIRDVASTIK